MPVLRRGAVARLRYPPILVLLTMVARASAQSEPERIAAILKEEIQSPNVSRFRVQNYILERVAKPPSPANASAWSAEAAGIRERLLRDVVFHGWPDNWVKAPPKCEDRGVIETGHGYRLRKLRYEIVPGFESAAILYEPEHVLGRAPAILNVNGHVGAPGKAVEYKQKRCINFAKRGIFALNLEWFAFGELSNPENRHWFGAHLDLVGTHELGLFMLAMRRGLDYLAQHPGIDPDRLGVTGLSGGGWQTIMLSAFDDRVRVAVPVAGFSATSTKVEARERGDLGDLEQSPTDLFARVDYPWLVALRAPRPTLLIHNNEDDCCFRAPLVKSLIFDSVRPVYQLYGKGDALDWYENSDPGTHNYQIDNRRNAYRFFGRHFDVAGMGDEIISDSEILSQEELLVGLPEDNLTILGLARELAEAVERPPIPIDTAARAGWVRTEREKLRKVVRYAPVSLRRVWAVSSTKSAEVESKSYLFAMDNNLDANAVWLKAIRTPENTPATIVLDDRGKRESAGAVSERVNRGEQVLALDLLFTGDAWSGVDGYSYQQILQSLGERALGMEVAQLVEIARWLRDRAGGKAVRLETSGIRNQVLALVAGAIEPELFSERVTRGGMQSLKYLLDKPVTFQEAGELFCLDLYREFDIDRLAALATPRGK